MNPNIHYNHSVLLGSAGTGTAFAAALALRRRWSQSINIVAMDINPGHLVTTQLLANAFEQVPRSASEEFVTALLDLLHRHSIDTYLPLFPEEVAVAARLKSEGRLPDTLNVLAPPLSGSLLCADKHKLTEFLKAKELPVPLTRLATNPFEAEYFFFKPKSGSGSHGACKVGAADLAKLPRSQVKDWIVQEICEGPEVTVDAFVDPDAKCFVVCRERIEVKTGVSTKCRLFEDPELRSITMNLAKALNFRGCFCFQVMRNKSGWAIIDVNPRPGAATSMCAVTGNDFFAAYFAFSWGEEFTSFFTPIAGEQFVTRQYTDFLMPSAS